MGSRAAAPRRHDGVALFVIHLIDTRGAAASGRTIAAPTVHVRNVGQMARSSTA